MMRNFINIVESVLHELKTFRLDNNRWAQYGNTSEITFFQHATPAELLTICEKAGMLRGMVMPPDFGEKLVWWKAADGLHIDACAALGLPGGSSSDEDRRDKLVLQHRDGEFILDCHVSRVTNPEVQALISAGVREAAYER